MLKGFKQIEFNNEKKLISAINKKTAGIIIEPIQGEGGIRPANLSFLKLLRKICNEKKILLFSMRFSVDLEDQVNYFHMNGQKLNLILCL